MALSQVTLVLGGARSGKSAFAESLVQDQAGKCIYIATAEALDGEMAGRIRRHRLRRGERWRTVEAPLDLAGALAREAGPNAAVLVDCLTLWLSNLMAAERDVEAETQALTEALAGFTGQLVLVSSEVGSGIVPESALARAFRDHAGALHQAVAAASDRVIMVTAGLPLVLKGGAE